LDNCGLDDGFGVFFFLFGGRVATEKIVKTREIGKKKKKIGN